MWHFQWDQPDASKPSLGFGTFYPWYESIDFSGADQMTIMRQFYEDRRWHTLRPLGSDCFTQDTSDGFMLTFDNEDFKALFMPLVTADDEMKTIVAYYSPTNRFKIGLRTLVQPRYRAYWFRPQDGKTTVIDEHVVPENGCWFAPVKAVEGDMILVLEALDPS